MNMNEARRETLRDFGLEPEPQVQGVADTLWQDQQAPPPFGHTWHLTWNRNGTMTFTCPCGDYRPRTHKRDQA